MRRYELSDDQWELICDLFPVSKNRQDRPWRSHRQVFNGTLWVLFSGAAWRDLPERYGPLKTVSGRFRRWRDDGTFDLVLKKLQLKLDKEGLLDWSACFVDSTVRKIY